MSNVLTSIGRFCALPILIAALTAMNLVQAGAEDIYPRLIEQVIQNRFNTARNLKEYAKNLPPRFCSDLAALNSGEYWVDLGHGFGFAGLDYLTLEAGVALCKDAVFGSARGSYLGIGMTHPKQTINPASANDAWLVDNHDKYMDRINVLGRADQFSEIHGKFLQDYSDAELREILKSAKVVTSVWGPFTYMPAEDVSPQLERILRFVPKGATLHLASSHINFDLGEESLSRYQSWASRMSGVEVQLGKISMISLAITKMSDNVRIPKLIPRSADYSMTPPARQFEVEGPTPVEEAKSWFSDICQSILQSAISR